MQLSRPAACSNRKGPRFSVWHDTQLSLIQLPTLSRRTLVLPCGLWHDEHVIFPSATGMCETRDIFSTCVRWQLTHRLCSSAAFSCARSATGLWTLWQVMQDRFRTSCVLPSHNACEAFAWQVRHVALTSCGDIFGNLRMVVSSPGSSTWRDPGPWQLSHPLSAAGDRGLALFQCGVEARCLAASSWQPRQVSLPT